MDNNKNQRLVNYLSAILLILIVVIVSYTIYTQQPKSEPIVSTTTTTSTENFYSSGRAYFISKNSLFTELDQLGIEVSEDFFELNTPESQRKLLSISLSRFGEMLAKKTKDEAHPIRELSLAIRGNDNGVILIIDDNLSNLEKMQEGDTMIFGINIEDVLNNQKISFPPNKTLYFCSIIKPPFGQQIIFGLDDLNTDHSLFFEEGTISCNDGLKAENNNLIFAGVDVLSENDRYNAKIYLVDENTRSEIQKSSSFSEAEEILNNYQLIYEKILVFPKF